MRLTYDTETRSEIELPDRGLDNYARHPSTEVICATIATDNYVASCSFIDSSDGREALENEMRALGLYVIPPELLLRTLRAADVIVASNAPFDQAVTAHRLGVDIPKEKWSCTQARAMRISLPGSLEKIAKVLNLPEGKDKEGNRLSRQVWKPRPAWSKWHHTPPALRKKADPGPKWFDDAKRLARNCAYNAADVRVSRMADKVLPELEPGEWEIWQHVWDMRQAGIPLDMEMINGAITMAEESRRDVTERIREYTGGLVSTLQAPGQLVAWAERYGYYMPSFSKDSVAEALADPNCPEPVKVVAAARQEAGKGSVAKFEKAADMVSADARLRHQIEYAGTAPTQRLAGRGVQPLNLPRPKVEADKSAALADIKAGRPIRVPQWKLDYDPERALAAIKAGNLAELRNIGDPEEILSENIRPMIEAPPGKIIVSPDLSAIEARGTFWISSCEHALVAYRKKEDLYCSLASTIVGFPVNKKDHPEERQLGKVGILSCGYGAGAATVARTNKIDEEQAYQIVQAYRVEYPQVKRTWYELENAATEAIRHPGFLIEACNGRVLFVFDGGWLKIRRPSGTWMYLPEAGIGIDGRLYYHAWIKGGWREESIWGGVLINFVVQGMCREIMYGAEMLLAKDPRFELFLQCYDSLSALVDERDGAELCEHMIRVMTTPPAWAPDFPLAAEGKPKKRYA